jgi:spore germination protein GerM
MQKTRLLLTFMICIAAIMMLVGCNILDNLIKDGGGSAPLSSILNKQTENGGGDGAIPVITDSPQGESTIKLYFADKSGQKLIEVNRTIPKTLSLARETVSQWLMGPSGSSDAYMTVSPQTILRDINIKNGVATVDLSKEFLEPYSNVTAESALYGLVNTVSQFSTVQIVQIRVEGKEITTYRGINLNDLRFRNDMIGFSSGPAAQGGIAPIQDEQTQEDRNIASGTEKKESPSAMNIFVN